MHIRKLLAAVVVGAFAWSATADEDTNRALAALKGVTREGKGNDDAAPAWKTIVSKGAPALMPILEAFDDSNPTSANWLRTAVDAIVEAEKAAGHPLPLDRLETFAKNPKAAALARTVAYEIVATTDPKAKERLLPGFLDDKSADLRRDAIAFNLETLEKEAKPTLKDDLLKLFAYSRDKDQVEAIAKRLAELGTKVSISEHFGFATHFALIGPFDSTGGKGFATAYPPESATGISETYTGKDSAALKWKPCETTDMYGTFDINKLLEKHKQAVAYALAIVVAESDVPCEIRVAAPNATQIFLNSKVLFGREEYHHGSPLDANIGKGMLKKGENVIVLKVCQNNQTEPWAQTWQFQLRVCDATGGPIAGLKQKLPESGKTIALGYIPEGTETKEDKK